MRHLDFQHLRNLSFARNRTKQSGTQDIEEGQNQERQPSADRPPGTALDDCSTLRADFEREASPECTLRAAFELEASPEWCDWYAGLSEDQRETLKKVLDESIIEKVRDGVNEGADREDNTAILVVQQVLMLWFSVVYFVRGQAIYSGWWLEGDEKWTCAWGYTVSIVMYKPITFPMWCILLQ